MLKSDLYKDRPDSARRGAALGGTSGKPRLVDPVTSDHDYSADELEFMGAMTDYQASSGRKFPTWREVLGVVKSLGYAKNRPQEESPTS
jgi:hypothetical protein